MNFSLQAKNWSTLGILTILFLILVMLSNGLFKGIRIDLTENKLYTMSNGTKNILKTIEEPINFYFFFSDKASTEVTFIRDYAQRVKEMLESFVLYSDNKIRLEIIDPLSFSEEEDKAASFGLQAIPIGAGGNSIYFGLAATNSLDDVVTIPFFQPNKETLLEYDLSQLVYSLSQPNKPIIGLMSALPLNGGFNPQTQQMDQPWTVITQLEDLFEIKAIPLETQAIENDIDVIMLVHPKQISQATEYALDQFVMKGGKLLVFVDPVAEMDQASNPGMPTMPGGSNLPTLLPAWGIEYNANQVVTDRTNAIQIPAQRGQPNQTHAGILDLRSPYFSSNDIITTDMDRMNLSSTGFFTIKEELAQQWLSLINSSEDVQLVPTQQLVFLQDPNQLLKNFEPLNETKILAARFSGKLNSAFPAGNPNSSETSEIHLTESQESANIIIVADTDLLADRLWVQVQNLFGQRLMSAWANNGDFVVNAIDNLTGSADLISIRTRASSQRPFDHVEELRRLADQNFRKKEEELQKELEETEATLAQLQQQRNDAGNLILTPEQQAEIERFQNRKLEISKELRQVRHELDRDIESLGAKLKFINIALVPFILMIIGTYMSIRRHRKSAV